MLNNLRNFSKSRFAGILIAIIIVPFVFWGMGSVFSGGNKNTVVKINNKNISIKYFTNHIRNLGVSDEYIRENLKNNYLETLLNDLISKEIILMEIDKRALSLNDKILLKKIKSNPEFKDDNQFFSRIKYEKFLLLNNISAPQYELQLKNNELQTDLFNFIKGGIKNPYFISNQFYIYENKKVKIDFINLENIYKKDFKEEELKEFIDKNKEKLSKEFIDFKYLIIDPIKITNEKDFNEQFFEILDDIENKINNNFKIEEISKIYDLPIVITNNFRPKVNKENKLLDLIYSKKNNKINLIEQEEFFLLYEIKDSRKKKPEFKKCSNFYNEVLTQILLNEKIKLNNKLLEKIRNNDFNRNDFIKISNQIDQIVIKNIKDTKVLPWESLQVIYNTPKGKFNLVADNDNNIYIFNVVEINSTNLNKSEKDFTKYQKISKDKIGKLLFESYDTVINNNYDVNINKKTIERIKNIFR